MKAQVLDWLAVGYFFVSVLDMDKFLAHSLQNLPLPSILTAKKAQVLELDKLRFLPPLNEAAQN